MTPPPTSATPRATTSTRCPRCTPALGLHGTAIRLMWLSGADVDRPPPDAREAWPTIHAAAPPPRTVATQPPHRPLPATRRAIVASVPPAVSATPAVPATLPPEDGPAGVIGPPPAASAPPLDLRLPPHTGKGDGPLTPARQAMRDPRSNTLRLALAERLLLDLGSAECIAWQRLPDGTIRRGPGHLRDVPGMPSRPDGTRVRECVR